MRKKIIAVLLILSLSFSYSFAFVYFVQDSINIAESIANRMELIEEHVERVKKWAEDLLQYKRHYEQILRYYEELKGIAEKFGSAIASGDILGAWQNAKNILSSYTKLAREVEQTIANSAKTAADAITEYSYLINDFNSLMYGENSWREERHILMQNRERMGWQYTHPFATAIRRTDNATTKFQEVFTYNQEYYQQMIDSLNSEKEATLQIKTAFETEAENEKIVVETLEKEIELWEDSIKVIDNLMSQNANEVISSISTNSLTEMQTIQFNLSTNVSLATKSDRETIIDNLQNELNTHTKLYESYMDGAESVQDAVDSLDAQIEDYQTELDSLINYYYYKK